MSPVDVINVTDQPTPRDTLTAGKHKTGSVFPLNLRRQRLTVAGETFRYAAMALPPLRTIDVFIPYAPHSFPLVAPAITQPPRNQVPCAAGLFDFNRLSAPP